MAACIYTSPKRIAYRYSPQFFIIRQRFPQQQQQQKKQRTTTKPVSQKFRPIPISADVYVHKQKWIGNRERKK